MKFCKIILVFMLWGFSASLFAQDTLKTNNGSLMIVKIIEVAPNSVKYKKFDNLSGPDYVIDKSEVSEIIYQNGSKDVFGKIKPIKEDIEEKEDIPSSNDQGRHYIGINLLDFIVTDISLMYEYTTPNQRFGFRIPVTIGFNNRKFGTLSSGSVFGYNTILRSGLDLRIYPGRVRKVRYVFGPSVNVSYVNRSDGFDYNTNQEIYRPDYFMRFIINNGIVVTPFNGFRLGLDAGPGIITNFRDFDEFPFDNMNRPTIYINFHMGYKF